MFRSGENCKRICPWCRTYALPRKHFSNYADVVVGNSRFVLDRHLSFGYFADTPKKKVIYNTYQVNSAALPSKAPSLPIRFGYLGRLAADKGPEVLLKSVGQLPKGTWTLDIAGRGLSAYERYLHERYRAPAIRFLGFVRSEIFFYF